MPTMSMSTNGLGLGVSQTLPIRNEHLDELLAQLSEHQVKLRKQTTTLHAQSGGEMSPDSSGSGALTNPYATTPRTDSQFNDISQTDMAEMVRLKKELETAQTQIARMDQELSQSRITKHTLEQAMGSQFDSDFDHIRDLRPQGVAARVDNWVQSTEPGAPPVNTNLNTNATQMPPPAARGIWGPGPSIGPGGLGGPGGPGVIGQPPSSTNGWALADPRVMAGGRLEADGANMFPIGPNPRGCPPGLRIDTTAMSPYLSEPSPAELSMRSGHSRPASAFGNHLHPWAQFSPRNNAPEHSGLTPPLTPLSFQSMQTMHNLTGMPHPMSDQALMNNLSFASRSNGTTLSPTAVEFQTGGFANAGWNAGQQVSLSIT